MVTHVEVTLTAVLLVKLIEKISCFLSTENRTVRQRSSLEHFKTIISQFSGINPPNQGNSRGTRRDWLVSYPRHVFWLFYSYFLHTVRQKHEDNKLSVHRSRLLRVFPVKLLPPILYTDSLVMKKRLSDNPLGQQPEVAWCDLKRKWARWRMNAIEMM